VIPKRICLRKVDTRRGDVGERMGRQDGHPDLAVVGIANGGMG